MNALPTTAPAYVTGNVATRRSALAWARAAIGLGIASSIVYAAVGVFTTTTSGGGAFQHTADYWYTGVGIPIALAGITLLAAVHVLQRGRDRGLGVAGVVVNTLALAVLAVQLLASVVTGVEQQWGPSYVLATAATFVGHALFSAGSWKVGLLPKWMLGVWPVVWVIGTFAAIAGALPLLLVAFYIVLGILLTRRADVETTA